MERSQGERPPSRQAQPRARYVPGVHLNLAVRGMPSSATVAINERSLELQRQGRDVVRFGLGQSPFPVPEPVVEALRRNAHEKDYLAVRGLAALREAVAHQHHRLHGVRRSADDVLVGPGSKELMFLLQLVFYGDLVIPTPAWVSYAPQARIIGRQVRFLPTRPEEHWHLHADVLRELCEEDPARPRIVVLNYPSNPTGRTYDLEELRRLARVAREHRVILLSDEIYGLTHHRGQHVSISRFYPEGTIVSSGLSKWCGAGGWRLGTFVFPPPLRWLLDAMAAAASETYTSTSAPIQHAAVTAFEGGDEIETYLQLSRRVLRTIARWAHARLVGAGLDCAHAQGAFYLFPDFGPLREALAARGVRTSADLAARLLEETGVAVLPGSEFGRPPAELTVRIAYVDFDGAAALDVAARVPRLAPIEDEFVHEHCPRVASGIERIAAWAKA